MPPTGLPFIHCYEPGGHPTATPLLLLHGTGGDERDLLPLGRALSPGAPLLSPRGEVTEADGARRFFRRHAEGVLDEPDLRERTGQMADFVHAARRYYGLPAPFAVGFSNGANLAASMLMLRPDALAGAVLLRAMPPFAERPGHLDPGQRPVLLLSGARDPLIPLEAARRLAADLQSGHARLTYRVLSAGHGLTREDVAIAATWLADWNNQQPDLAETTPCN